MRKARPGQGPTRAVAIEEPPRRRPAKPPTSKPEGTRAGAEPKPTGRSAQALGHPMAG